MKLLKIEKLLQISLALLLLFSLSVVPSFAQSDETTEILQDIEDERTQDLEDQLALTIPEITDNPNHIITFTNPSPNEDDTVQLEIDGQGFKKITSPYTLPSLGIGDHVLTFRFNDKEETRQTIEKTLVVIPRPPVINAPETVSTTEITFSGTALVGSTIDLFLAGGTVNLKAETEVDTDGGWTHTFESTFPIEIYNIVAVSKKNGFASTFSETVVFEITNEDTTKSTGSTLKPIHFAFNDLTTDNIRSTISNNLDLLYLVIGSFLIGALIVFFLLYARRANRIRKVEGSFLQQFFGKREDEKKAKKNKNGKGEKDTKTMTLREKFENAGYNKDNQEAKAEAKSMTKDEFLKKFKEQDPDDAKGKERKKKKSKRKTKKKADVPVSLTTPKKK